MEFERLWDTMTQALHEPVLLSVTGARAEPGERFHAWFDPGGDGKPEAVWTKPYHGERQVRLPHRKEEFAKVYEAALRGVRDPESLRAMTLRGHYLFELMKHFGLEPDPRRRSGQSDL